MGRAEHRKPESRPCPLCGAHDSSNVYAEAKLDPAALDQYAFASRKVPEFQHHRLVICPSCDLLYASPVPPPGELADAYREAAFDSGEESRFAARTYFGLLSRFVHRLPDRHGALDIGAGDGAFLQELLDAGFSDVVGVEPSAAPVNAAPPEIRKLIVHDIFRPGLFAPGLFSLVTCFQTLEHVPDPLALCRAALDLLKSGGMLFVVSHDRQALTNRLLGTRSPIIDIEHLQLFCRTSIRRLLETAGFVRVRTLPVWNQYPLHYWMRLLPMPRGMKRRLLPRFRELSFGRMPLAIPAGNLAAVGRRA